MPSAPMPSFASLIGDHAAGQPCPSICFYLRRCSDHSVAIADRPCSPTCSHFRILAAAVGLSPPRASAFFSISIPVAATSYLSTLRCSSHHSRLTAYTVVMLELYVVQLYEPASVGSPWARGPGAHARAIFPTALPKLSRPAWRGTASC